MVKNLHGNTGWIPELEIFYMLQDNEAHGPQILSWCAIAAEALTARAVLHNKRNYCNEMSMHHNQRVASFAATRESSHGATRTQRGKNNK